MNALISWLQSAAAERLGWMLVHSLWQLALLAGVYLLVRQMLRRASAAARYVAACAIMVCMVLVLPVTALLIQGQPATLVPPRTVAAPPPARVQPSVPPPAGESVLIEIQPSPTVALPPPEPAVTNGPVGSTVNWKERLEAVFKTALPWVVIVWMAGVLALALRQFGGWVMLRRLCGTGTEPVNEVLAERMRKIATQLGVRRAVRLLSSVNIAVPSVIGHLKPVILMPASLISGLSTQQIEAILAHELAHIRRHDYLVNLIQVTCETVLFYHPAVWWISREIRREREHCCDDLAVQVCGDRIAYARLLATLEERRFDMPTAAMAVTGGSLIQRIRRIVGQPAAQHTPHGTWLAGMLVVLSVCALIPLGFSAATGSPDKFDFKQSDKLPELSPKTSKQIEAWASEVAAGKLSEEDFLIRVKKEGPVAVRGLILLMDSGKTDRLAIKGIEQFLDEPAVVDYLAAELRDLSTKPSHISPNTRHCCLLLLGKSKERKHTDLVAGFLEKNDIAAMHALADMGGEKARDYLIGAFDRIPTDKWWLLAEQLERVGDPTAVPELKRRLAMVELPPNDRFPSRTVFSFTTAIAALSESDRVSTTLIEWAQGVRFRYPYDGPGLPKSFSVDPQRHYYIHLPDVDSRREEGRKAIWQAFEAATKGPGFTIDGDEIVPFNGLRVMPLWQDGPPYPTTWYDWLDRTSHRDLLDRIERNGLATRSRIPQDGLLLGVDQRKHLHVIRLMKTADDYQYNVAMRALDPLRLLVRAQSSDHDAVVEWRDCTLHDLESETKDGSLNLSRGHMEAMTREKWRSPPTDAILVAEFAGNAVGLGIAGAQRFLLTEAGQDWESSEQILALLKSEANQQTPIARHHTVESDGANFHQFANLQPGRRFAFAVEMPNTYPVAGVMEVLKMDRIAETLEIRHRFLPTAAARDIFAKGESGLKLIPPILQSLKQEVVALSKEFPQLAGAEAVPVKPDGWLFERDCRDMGQRGYEDTGSFPVAIGLKVMTAKDYREQAGKAEMPHPNFEWGYLGLVGWITLYTGEGGMIPSELVGKLQEALRNVMTKLGPLNRQALAASLPQAVQTQRDRLLAEADAKIRSGIRQLAETFPQLKKGPTWERLGDASAPGRIGIYHVQQPGKGAADPAIFPPAEKFSVLVVIKPPPDETEQLMLFAGYARLGLVGQVGTGAADPALDAALKKLVNEALAPLAELEARTAGQAGTQGFHTPAVGTIPPW